jgi:predicted DNA-binding transcriptional regulator AlpA
VQDKAYTIQHSQIGSMEAWVSNTEMHKHLGVSRKTLWRLHKYFSEGVHWRRKDPLNPNSHKVWRLSSVDQLLSQPTNVLKRRAKKV